MSMVRFWDFITKDLLTEVQPSRMVEIGADYFLHTKRLLDYCVAHGATLTVIDPAPKANVEQLKKKYGDHLDFVQNLSLNVLEHIISPQVVFIDGDHNYYTVLHELLQLENSARRSNVPFPITLLHDISWPYGRRDLYYNPDSIPPNWRQDFARRGISFGKTELTKTGGINGNLCNAVREGGPKNGVLTAVEDFVFPRAKALHLVRIPAHNGLGVIFDRETVRAIHWVGGFVSALERLPNLEDFVANLENQGHKLRQDMRDARMSASPPLTAQPSAKPSRTGASLYSGTAKAWLRDVLFGGPVLSSSSHESRSHGRWTENLQLVNSANLDCTCLSLSLDQSTTSYHIESPQAVIHTERSRPFDRFFQASVRSISPRRLLGFKNAIVVDKGAIITNNGAIVTESTNLAPNIINDNKLVRSGRSYRYDGATTWSIEVEPVLLASKRGIQSFGHFITEVVPRLHRIVETGLVSDRKIMLHQATVSKWREIFDAVSLTTAGYREHSDVEPVLCKDVLFPTYWGHHPLSIHPEVFDYWEKWMTRKLGAQLSEAGRQRLFITPSEARPGQLLNLDSVQEALAAFGFISTRCDMLSFTDQAKLFRNAEIVVGVAGDSMANLVFSPSNIPVIVLSPETVPSLFFWTLCAQKRQKFHLVYGRTTSTDSSAMCDFTVSTEDVRRLVGELLESS